MKSTLFTFVFSTILCLSCIIPTAPVFAQLSVGLSDSDVSLDISPSNPGPNQRAYVSIDSFATNLNAVNISWSVNGKQVLTGIGKKDLTITTGKLGQKTTVVVTIDSVTGTLTKTVTITPASVDMIWEAQTYTPPFFKGKPLFTYQSTVTYTAIPHIIRNGVEIPPQNLIYTWANNGTVLGSLSGYGKSSLTIAGSLIPRPMDITVEATNVQGDSVADGEVVLTPQAPFITLYKNDPLYGVQYERALSGTFGLTGNEVDITAVPYYFGTNNSTSNLLTYTWEINGVPLSDDINAPTKAFRRVGDVLGTSNISLAVAHRNAMFQTANGGVVIDFQK